MFAMRGHTYESNENLHPNQSHHHHQAGRSKAPARKGTAIERGLSGVRSDKWSTSENGFNPPESGFFVYEEPSASSSQGASRISVQRGYSPFPKASVVGPRRHLRHYLRRWRASVLRVQSVKLLEGELGEQRRHERLLCSFRQWELAVVMGMASPLHDDRLPKEPRVEACQVAHPESPYRNIEEGCTSSPVHDIKVPPAVNDNVEEKKQSVETSCSYTDIWDSISGSDSSSLIEGANSSAADEPAPSRVAERPSTEENARSGFTFWRASAVKTIVLERSATQKFAARTAMVSCFASFQRMRMFAASRRHSRHIGALLGRHRRHMDCHRSFCKWRRAIVPLPILSRESVRDVVSTSQDFDNSTASVIAASQLFRRWALRSFRERLAEARMLLDTVEKSSSLRMMYMRMHMHLEKRRAVSCAKVFNQWRNKVAWVRGVSVRIFTMYVLNRHNLIRSDYFRRWKDALMPSEPTMMGTPPIVRRAFMIWLKSVASLRRYRWIERNLSRRKAMKYFACWRKPKAAHPRYGMMRKPTHRVYQQWARVARLRRCVKQRLSDANEFMVRVFRTGVLAHWREWVATQRMKKANRDMACRSAFHQWRAEYLQNSKDAIAMNLSKSEIRLNTTNNECVELRQKLEDLREIVGSDILQKKEELSTVIHEAIAALEKEREKNRSLRKDLRAAQSGTRETLATVCALSSAFHWWARVAAQKRAIENYAKSSKAGRSTAAREADRACLSTLEDLVKHRDREIARIQSANVVARHDLLMAKNEVESVRGEYDKELEKLRAQVQSLESDRTRLTRERDVAIGVARRVADLPDNTQELITLSDQPASEAPPASGRKVKMTPKPPQSVKHLFFNGAPTPCGRPGEITPMPTEMSPGWTPKYTPDLSMSISKALDLSSNSAPRRRLAASPLLGTLMSPMVPEMTPVPSKTPPAHTNPRVPGSAGWSDVFEDDESFAASKPIKDTEGEVVPSDIVDLEKYI